MRVNFGLYTEKERKPMDTCSMLMDIFMHVFPSFLACTAVYGALGAFGFGWGTGANDVVRWEGLLFPYIRKYIYIYIHTHIYIYMCAFMYIFFSHVLACDLPSLSCQGKEWEKKKAGNVLFVCPSRISLGGDFWVISIVLASLFRGAASLCFSMLPHTRVLVIYPFKYPLPRPFFHPGQCVWDLGGSKDVDHDPSLYDCGNF